MSLTMKYCPDCGVLLKKRDLGDEIGVPWCDECNHPWFSMFPIVIIALIANERGEVLLLRQNYISREFHNLVSGYIKPGESAEECAMREILEETGLRVDKLSLRFTSWFAKKEMLMIAFVAHTKDTEITISSEVDEAGWYPPEEILQHLSTNPGSTSRMLAEDYLRTL